MDLELVRAENSRLRRDAAAQRPREAGVVPRVPADIARGVADVVLLQRRARAPKAL